MAPKPTKDRCKKYHQKHKEVYREKDALQKKKFIAKKMKSNAIASEERLRVRRSKKQKYRQRVKKKYSSNYCRKSCVRKKR